jgi:hypothetical protein
MAKRSKPTTVRLSPRLVPKPLWGWSAARRLSRGAWLQIRDCIISANGLCCSTSGCSGYADECDEEWVYDEGPPAIATLASLRMLCHDCHACVHIGRSQLRGEKIFKRAMLYLSKVNDISAYEVYDMVRAAHTLHRRRSAVPWAVRVAPSLLARFPALGAIEREAQ